MRSQSSVERERALTSAPPLRRHRHERDTKTRKKKDEEEKKKRNREAYTEKDKILRVREGSREREKSEDSTAVRILQGDYGNDDRRFKAVKIICTAVFLSPYSYRDRVLWFPRVQG